MKFQELKHRFNKKYAVRIIAGVLTIALVGTGSAVYSVSIAKAENEFEIYRAREMRQLKSDFGKAIRGYLPGVGENPK